MELLLERARPYLREVDFAGHFSALETIDRRTGDCTEAAVLLAALGRAAGIPTRVVSGLVYSRQRYHGVSNAFMPHSWVLAYVDGRWRSFDLALDRFDSYPYRAHRRRRRRALDHGREPARQPAALGADGRNQGPADALRAQPFGLGAAWPPLLSVPAGAASASS